MKKNIKELKKIMEEIAKIESESLRTIEKISNQIKKERREKVEYSGTLIKNPEDLKCNTEGFSGAFSNDIRTPASIKNGGKIKSA